MGIRDEIKDSNRNCESCQPVEVPTRDELVALNALRAIKDRVREIKKELSDISYSEKKEDKDKKMGLETDMKRLKSEWKEWEEKKEHAARERMILLGHEEP